MIDQQPAFIGLDGHRACANLSALPAGVLELGGSHHVAMLAPELHVVGLGNEDITEGSVTGVGRTGHQHILAVDLAGEQNTVTVVGQEGILQLMECLEVLSVANADGGAMVAVAPGDVVLAIQIANAGVITVDLLGHNGIALKYDGIVTDLPVDTILGEANIDVHLDSTVVAAENAGEAITKGNHSAVENTVGTLSGMASNDGVLGVTPDGHEMAFRSILPGDILQFRSDNLAHNLVPHIF